MFNATPDSRTHQGATDLSQSEALQEALRECRLTIIIESTCAEPGCTSTTRTIEHTNEMYLGLPHGDQPLTLQGLITSNYGGAEEVGKDCLESLFYQTAEMSRFILQLQSSIIVRYKRTAYDIVSGLEIKKNNHIRTEGTLDLWRVLHPEVRELYNNFSNGRELARFELTGLIRHFGESNGMYSQSLLQINANILQLAIM